MSIQAKNAVSEAASIAEQWNYVYFSTDSCRTPKPTRFCIDEETKQQLLFFSCRHRFGALARPRAACRATYRERGALHSCFSCAHANKEEVAEGGSRCQSIHPRNSRTRRPPIGHTSPRRRIPRVLAYSRHNRAALGRHDAAAKEVRPNNSSQWVSHTPYARECRRNRLRGSRPPSIPATKGLYCSDGSIPLGRVWF